MTTNALQPVAGEDLLARRGGLVLLCSAADHLADTVDALVEAHSEVADAGEDATALADRIDGIVAAAPAGLDLVLLGPAGPSLLVAVYGHAWANVTTEFGEQNLALRNATQLVRSVLSGQLKAMRAGLGDLDLELTADRWVSLGEGVIRAGGVVYTAPGAHSAAPAPLEPRATTPRVSPPPPPPPPPPAPAAVAPAPPIDPAASGPHMPDPVTEQPVAQEAPAPPPPPPLAPPAPPVAPPPAPPAPPAPPLAAPPQAAPPQAAPPLPPPPPPPPPPAAPAPVPEPVAAGPVGGPGTSQNFSAVSLIQGGSGAPEPEPPREPLPVVTAPPPAPAPDVAPALHPVDDGRPQVLGVYCKNGHFDDPSARYCAVCGISMAQLTLIPRPGPRPPLGVLVIDDGSVFSLDTDYVLGRDPSQDPDVISGTARPLRFDDAEGVLSRRHARIVLDGWQVTVVDLGSANGTGVKGPNDGDWHPVPARTSVALRPGSQIGLGRRNLRYESHRNT